MVKNMKIKQFMVFCVLILLLPFAFAKPLTPSAFAGTATLDSVGIVAGDVVEAYDPDGVLCATFTIQAGLKRVIMGHWFVQEMTLKLLV